MVFLHDYGQSRMGWMTTPDGRPGWSDLFLKMGHSVFLIDQPRRGESNSTRYMTRVIQEAVNAGIFRIEPADAV